ncbi:phosphate ABC transporter permease subunit PstC [Marinibactrum halimedae]|uniref:Phosphate transport system permease protein n=1 Tax=Marinibactrum halimedae TaxID=1444977 RepID=A0AA37T685_9GAMM|nr:phosphate ABC transporter permease subunit PstC [Marinibactrum halimedae]MCD9459979.1 phosphate ABC transporter permease subunit PstC [Marinibactrum halimedae]GLS28253.1 phosphate transport system permease protein [Marinibactrum halimedae]
MTISSLFAVIAVLMFAAYACGYQRSISRATLVGGQRHLHSLPLYYGLLTSLWCAIPSVLLIGLWLAMDDMVIQHLVVQSLPLADQNLPEAELGLLVNSVENYAEGVTNLSGERASVIAAAAERLNELRGLSRKALTVVAVAMAVVVAVIIWWRISPEVRARNHVERVFRVALLLASTFAVVTTIGIILSVVFESIRFFQSVPLTEFIFGTHWSPQIALREGQVGASGAFGSLPLFAGTLLVSAIAMVVAVPTGLMAAIYLSEYATKGVRNVVKPMLEVLAGIPTVVYGFFAALTVAPAIRSGFGVIGVDVSAESALAAGAVMGIMIIPFVSSLSDDVINAVPQSLRDGSLGLGATQSETIKRVVIPAALPGIVGGVLLAVSRAIGETMIVVMAAGLAANLTANPLESVTTVTVQIVTLLVGDQEFDSPKTLAAFALGLMLFIVTLTLNFIALAIVRKYREQYD